MRAEEQKKKRKAAADRCGGGENTGEIAEPFAVRISRRLFSGSGAAYLGMINLSLNKKILSQN